MRKHYAVFLCSDGALRWVETTKEQAESGSTALSHPEDADAIFAYYINLRTTKEPQNV